MNYLLYLSLLLSPKDTCRESFLNYLLQTTHSNDFFLIVKCKQKDEEFKVALTANELSQNFKMQGLPIDKEALCRINKNQVVFILSDSSKYLGIVPEQNEYVDRIKEKGQTFFLEYFFDKYGFLNDKLPEQASIGSIIEVLFNWNILVGESEGNLYVDRKRFCYDRSPN